MAGKTDHVAPKIRHGRRLDSGIVRIVRPTYAAPRREGDWR